MSVQRLATDGNARRTHDEVHVETADDDDRPIPLVGNAGNIHQEAFFWLIDGGRSAHLELRFKYHLAGFTAPRLDALEQQLRRQGTDLQLGLSHGGQRRGRKRGEFNVVETDHGELLGHPDSRLADGGQRAEGHQVVADEDGGRAWPMLEQGCMAKMTPPRAVKSPRARSLRAFDAEPIQAFSSQPAVSNSATDREAH